MKFPRFFIASAVIYTYHEKIFENSHMYADETRETVRNLVSG